VGKGIGAPAAGQRRFLFLRAASEVPIVPSCGCSRSSTSCRRCSRSVRPAGCAKRATRSATPRAPSRGSYWIEVPIGRGADRGPNRVPRRFVGHGHLACTHLRATDILLAPICGPRGEAAPCPRAGGVLLQCCHRRVRRASSTSRHDISFERCDAMKTRAIVL